MKYFSFFGMMLFGWVLFSCTPQAKEEQASTPLSVHEMRERLIAQNRAALEAERLDIHTFLDSSAIPFTPTGTGLYVWRQSFDATAPLLDTAQRVRIRSHVHGLHGQVFSQGLEQELSVLRDNDVIWGVQEALIQSHMGDSLICIVPAHLAHGLAGDFGDIPPLTPLVYYLRILQ
jgi:FKBP-type peptidyl-prolyl cis-trans isomerase FkpA